MVTEVSKNNVYSIIDHKDKLKSGDSVFVLKHLYDKHHSNIKYQILQGIFKGYNDNNNKQLSIIFKDDDLKKSLTLNSKTSIETNHETLIIPTVIKFNQIQKLHISSSPSKICLLPKILICEISSFLTFNNYLSLLSTNKLMQKILNENKLYPLNSLDLIHNYGKNIMDIVFNKICRFTQLKHLHLWAEDLERIKFCNAKANLKRLTILGDGLNNGHFVNSFDLHKSKIEYMYLCWFGTRNIDDEFSLSNNFNDSLFSNIKYLFMYHCSFQYKDINTMHKLFKSGLKGWGYFDSAGEYSTHPPFTNWIIQTFASKLEVLHIQAHDDIQIPQNTKFNNLKEFRMISENYNQNDMNTTNDILSKTNSLKRIAIQLLLSNTYSDRKYNLIKTIQRLFISQQELKEIILIDHYINARHIYRAVENGLYFSPIKKNIIILTIRFDNCFPNDTLYEISQICVITNRLINSLLGCYQLNNWRLNMQFTGSGSELYKEIKINKHLIKRLKNNYQVNTTCKKVKNSKTFDTFCLEIYSKNCIVFTRERWIFPLE